MALNSCILHKFTFVRKQHMDFALILHNNGFELYAPALLFRSNLMERKKVRFTKMRRIEDYM